MYKLINGKHCVLGLHAFEERVYKHLMYTLLVCVFNINIAVFACPVYRERGDA